MKSWSNLLTNTRSISQSKLVPGRGYDPLTARLKFGLAVLHGNIQDDLGSHSTLGPSRVLYQLSYPGLILSFCMHGPLSACLLRVLRLHHTVSSNHCACQTTRHMVGGTFSRDPPARTGTTGCSLLRAHMEFQEGFAPPNT